MANGMWEGPRRIQGIHYNILGGGIEGIRNLSIAGRKYTFIIPSVTRGQILGRKSFPLCYSQSPQLKFTPSPSKSGLKLVFIVNIVYGNLKSVSLISPGHVESGDFFLRISYFILLIRRLLGITISALGECAE
jgi:hypothetical protein